MTWTSPTALGFFAAATPIPTLDARGAGNAATAVTGPSCRPAATTRHACAAPPSGKAGSSSRCQRRTAPSAPPVTSQRPAVPSRARSHRTAVTSSRWPWSVLAIAASAGSYTATVACAPKA